MFSLDTSPFTIFFLIFGVGYPILLAYVVLSDRGRSKEEAKATEHVFSLLVPALDEEEVLEATIRALLNLDYPEADFEIVVIDDGSDDGTPEIVADFAARHPRRVRLFSIPAAASKRGKASALNTGYAHLRETSPFRRESRWIIGVFDADGRPDEDMLQKVSHQFIDSTVGGVQSSVRIRNSGAAWIARMQEVEFGAFARMTQLIRMRIASSATMGGNGQFVRAAALEDTALDRAQGIYWDPAALTEDLELAVRLSLRNWNLHHLNTTVAWQEGVERFRDLIRQRVRWAWGTLQIFVSYVLGLKIIRTPDVELRKRVDLLFHISMFILSPIVLILWILSALAWLGLLSVVNVFPTSFLVFLSLGYLPIVGYGLLTTQGYRKAHLPADLIGFVIYTYHWVPSVAIGIWHMIAGHVPVWRKTARLENSRRSPRGYRG